MNYSAVEDISDGCIENQRHKRSKHKYDSLEDIFLEVRKAHHQNTPLRTHYTIARKGGPEKETLQARERASKT